MAVVAVTAQNTRLDAAEVSTDWGNIGGGAAGAIQSDWFYQGSNSFARKGATASRGIFLSDDVDTDMTAAGNEVVIIKFSTITPGLLDLLAVPGVQLRIGSGSITASPSSDYHSYDVEGSDTWPVDKAWLLLAIDPNIAGYRTATTGTPDLTVVDFFALVYDQTATSKDLNEALDAVDIAVGLTLLGGDGADPDGTWQDFADFDFGTPGNRFGYFQSDVSPFNVLGKLVIGSATDTVFTDSGVVVVFLDGFYAAGWAGIEISLDTGNVYTEANGTFIGLGDTTTTDTRPTLVFTGAGGTSAITGCNYFNFGTMTLVGDVTWTGGNWTDSDQIIVAGQPTIDGLTITDPTNDGALLVDAANQLDNMKNVTFDGAGVGGTTADAAIEVDIAGAGPFTINLDNFAFLNKVAGSVHVHILANGNADYTFVLTNGTTLAAADVTNDGSGTVTIDAAVTVTVTVKDARGAVVEGVRVRVEEDPSGTLVSQGETNASGVFSFTFSGSTPQAVLVKARLIAFRVPEPLSETIASGTGLSVAFTLADDPLVNLP